MTTTNDVAYSLEEARTDIEDVLNISEEDLAKLGPTAKLLAQQIEDLACDLAILAEDAGHSTRYCEIW